MELEQTLDKCESRLFKYMMREMKTMGEMNKRRRGKKLKTFNGC